MKQIGFSTGAVAFGDFRLALELLAPLEVTAVELSALRLLELPPLLDALDCLDLTRYDYVSFHAPTKFPRDHERELVQQLRKVLEREWPIIVHPDSLYDHRLWEPLQEWLCFENMDKRKPVGRFTTELEEVFARFPKSWLCFDVGHAHQIDRTMTEAVLIAQRFAPRIRQVHVSEVNTRSEHVAISATTELALSKVTSLIHEDVPLIIESVLSPEHLKRELDLVAGLFENPTPYLLETD